MKQIRGIRLLFRKNAVTARLFWLFFVLFVMYLSAASVMWVRVGEINAKAKNIRQKSLLISNYSLRLNIAIGRGVYFAQNSLITEDILSITTYQQLWGNQVIPLADSLVNTAATLQSLDLQQRVQQLREDIILLQGEIDRFLNTPRNNTTRLRQTDNRINILFKNINKELVDIYQLEEESVRTDITEIENESWRIIYVSLLVVFVIILVGVIASNLIISRVNKGMRTIDEYLKILIGGNIPTEAIDQQVYELSVIDQSLSRLTRRFQRLKVFAEEVSQGYYNTEAIVFDNEGELGQIIASMRNSLHQISIENSERNWINEGFAKFSEILRYDDQDSQGFYDRIIAAIVDYLDINQGGIFTVESKTISEGEGRNQTTRQEHYMRLQAAYAFQRHKFLQKQIAEGEGLVGRAWRERDKVYLTEIPEDYAHITSGLGGSRPKSILIMPLISNEQVFGVLELAAFEVLPAYKIQFVERVSESIAIAIAKAQTDANNRRMMNESNVMLTQMRIQERQFKKIVEQLQRSEKETKHARMELESERAALDQVFSIAEIDKNGRFRTVNDVLKRLSGYSQQELIGQHFEILLGDAKNSIELSRRHWTQVLDGQILKSEFVRFNKNGKPFWMYEVVYPVIDTEGKVEKIYSIGYDITKQKEQEMEIKRQLEELQEAEEQAHFEIAQLKLEYETRLGEKEKQLQELKKQVNID
jgi:PAS domain S-box-containing protein